MAYFRTRIFPLLVTFFCICPFSISTLFAQQRGVISGSLQDADTKEAMAGALIELFPLTDSSARKYMTADAQGRFSFVGLPYREYAYNVSFLGYDTLSGRVKVNRSAVALGVLKMSPKAQDLDEVLVSARAM